MYNSMDVVSHNTDGLCKNAQRFSRICLNISICLNITFHVSIFQNQELVLENCISNTIYFGGKRKANTKLKLKYISYNV